jgi:hypothetical protein
MIRTMFIHPGKPDTERAIQAIPRPIKDRTKTRPMILLVVKVSLVKIVVEVTGVTEVAFAGLLFITVAGEGAGEDTITASGTALDISRGESFYSLD